MGADYSMRIWLNPEVMAQYKLVPSDIEDVLNEQNLEAATGSLGENSGNVHQYTMKYRGRLEKPEEFGNIVIRSLPDGEVLRLKDVASIELGAQNYIIDGQIDSHPAATCMVFQTAGSNANEVVGQIDEYLESIEKDLPKGVRIAHLMSTKDFLDASIHEIIKTLVEAIILVILITYVFLQNLRSTLISAVAIIISLVGTFAFLAIAGFSINLLTLFALVLAIGVVVDDAIIVVEAVQAKFDTGYKSPYPGFGGRHARDYVGNRHLYAGIYGRIHPCLLHGRHKRNILHAIRHHDGDCRRYLRRKRPDTQPGTVFAHHASRPGKRETDFFRTIPHGFRSLFQPHIGKIQDRNHVFHQTALADMERIRRLHSSAYRINVLYKDRACPAGRRRYGLY